MTPSAAGPLVRRPSRDVDPAELAADPHPVLADLRRSTPVCWVPSLQGWLVTSRRAVLQVLEDPAAFTVDDPRFTTAAVVGPSMLSRDGDEHRRHRRPFVPAFRPALVDRVHDAALHRLAAELVAPWRADGTAEIRTALAGPFAVAAVTGILGLREVTTEQLLGWYRTIVGAVTALSDGRDSGEVNAGRAAAEDLAAAVAEAVRGPDGLLAAAAGAGLDPDEVASNAAVILFGGIETVEGMVANAVLHVFSAADPRPDPDDDAAVAAAVEESLRLEPAAARVDRYATRDVVLDGVTVPAGDLVIASLSAANRDPDGLADPDAYYPDRHLADPPPPRGLAFAAGPHGCLAATLARRQAQVALRALLELPAPRLDAAASTPVRGLVFRKPDRVVLRWG